MMEAFRRIELDFYEAKLSGQLANSNVSSFFISLLSFSMSLKLYFVLNNIQKFEMKFVH